MRSLYHLPIDAPSRKIRILLAEKGLEVQLKSEKVWERREAFLKLNPAGEVPVLLEEDGTTIAGQSVIVEYLEELHPEPTMIGREPLDRAETRRLSLWFDEKLAGEVTEPLVEEKMMKRFLGMGQPDSSAIRAAHANLGYHLDYIAWLCDRRRWLAGPNFSLADVAAAAQVSVIDYLGGIPWESNAEAKDWYARVKSRPSLRSILADHVPGAPPAKHYADLDF